MSSPFFTIIMFVVLLGAWWMMSRSSKKQQQERQNTLNAMKPGDRAVTIGGLHGVISEINEAEKTVTLDCEGIYLEFDRQAIRTITPGQPTVDTAETTETEKPADAPQVGPTDAESTEEPKE
ncbi:MULTISPECIES: preprotein translocase subunit YajC [Enterococcus]|uniref:preprotein translocase subunit YajC n=1 Tax=Enterococcus TaxID=1350 RepID=UPI00065DC3B6|nr:MULTISPECIES: preprotein translocase subunit YajC [Enterococcus]KAF1300997.1 preprotein translocase subunit YajC [Enterococcus sp. JM9B]